MRNHKGTALFIVLSTLLVVVILANIALRIAASHSRLTNHQVSRIRAYYAAQAALVYTMEQLRKGTWKAPEATQATKHACLNSCVDTGVSASTDHAVGSPPTDVTYSWNDSDIPYNVQVKIFAKGTGPTGPVDSPETSRLEAKVDYSFM